jgi:thiamine-phosphate pyrophosphorylase
VGPDRLVGLSTHSLQQARQAVLDGANYIGVGPVSPSRTKQFGEFVGTALLREVAGEITLPAFAIGGISLENLEQVFEAGFRRVAVGAAISDARDPAATAVEFLKRLNS